MLGHLLSFKYLSPFNLLRLSVHLLTMAHRPPLIILFVASYPFIHSRKPIILFEIALAAYGPTLPNSDAGMLLLLMLMSVLLDFTS